MAITIGRNDARYETLKLSRNLRLITDPQDYANQVVLCSNSEQAAEALESIVKAGLRPTIRSGGHCYEDFVVNNPHGAILDLSLFKASAMPSDGDRYRISPGMELGEAYIELYKRHGVTIPAGSCYAVGAGGHISGGGYGLLSRLHGLTVDWVSQVEILTVDAKGHVAQRRIDKDHDPDLFRACLGSGGGSFGVITGFVFDQLPKAPREVATAHLSFDWDAMTEESFADLLTTFGDYWNERGRDPETWGLFAIMDISHKGSGRFGMGMQFCNPDGTCDDLAVLHEFIDRFKRFGPSPVPAQTSNKQRVPKPQIAPQRNGDRPVEKQQWLDATIGNSGSGSAGRAKYKSAYMKQSFSPEEAKCIYRFMSEPLEGIDLRSAVLAIDSYGGAANKPGSADRTSIPQRSSLMKLQWQHYWHDPSEDARRLQWTHDFYQALYSTHAEPGHAGTPFPGERYDGCYINYPDIDMLAYDYWPQLYYGTGDLYPFLQKVKRQYDPNNVFHHAMSIRA